MISKEIERNTKKHNNWFWEKDPEATIHYVICRLQFY